MNIEFDQLDKILLEQEGKIIHQVWFGTIPNINTAKYEYKKLAKYQQSWIEKNPSWYHVVWNKKMSEQLIRLYYIEHYNMFFGYPYDIQRCDMVRYCFLHRYGGLYADMDYYCCISFDKVIKKYKNNFYLVQTPNMPGEYVSNSLMYSESQRHPFWSTLLVEMQKVQNPPIYYSQHLQVMFTAGPGIVNRVFQRFKSIFKLESWPHKYFQPHGQIDTIMSLNIPNVYTIHASKGCWHASDSKVIGIVLKEWPIIVFILIILIGVNLIFNIFDRKSNHKSIENTH